SSALRTATTPWLASVARTRWSSAVHSRFLSSKTERVPQSCPSSSIGVQIAASSPARSGGDASSACQARSPTTVARPLSIVAPTTPWPFWKTVPLGSAASQTAMMATWCPSEVVRVSIPAVPSTTRIAASLVFRDQVTEHGLAIPHPRERSVDGLGSGRIAVERAIGVVRLEQQCTPGVVADHLRATPDDELEHLFHGLSRGLFHELVHERVP